MELSSDVLIIFTDLNDQNEEASRVKHLAELLDEFNLTHPTIAVKKIDLHPKSGEVENTVNSSTGFTSTDESAAQRLTGSAQTNGESQSSSKVSEAPVVDSIGSTDIDRRAGKDMQVAILSVTLAFSKTDFDFDDIL